MSYDLESKSSGSCKIEMDRKIGDLDTIQQHLSIFGVADLAGFRITKHWFVYPSNDSGGV